MFKRGAEAIAWLGTARRPSPMQISQSPMSQFRPRMIAQTHAYHTLRPLAFRSWSGVVADVWHVRGENGGGGHYLSPDPRLVLFLDPVQEMALSQSPDAFEPCGVTAFYIPPMQPLWSRLGAACEFAHLDFHFEPGAFTQRIAAAGLSGKIATARMRTESPRCMDIARMVADEIRTPTRADALLDGLLLALLAEFFEAPLTTETRSTPSGDRQSAPARGGPARGGLSPRQMTQLRRYVRHNLASPLSVAEMARVVGLSESWFAHSFRTEMNASPQQWLMSERLSAAGDLLATSDLSLAEIAQAAGFADQSHLTRRFSKVTGISPGRWRRHARESDSPGQKETGPFNPSHNS